MRTGYIGQIEKLFNITFGNEWFFKHNFNTNPVKINCFNCNHIKNVQERHIEYDVTGHTQHYTATMDVTYKNRFANIMKIENNIVYYCDCCKISLWLPDLNSLCKAIYVNYWYNKDPINIYKLFDFNDMKGEPPYTLTKIKVNETYKHKDNITFSDNVFVNKLECNEKKYDNIYMGDQNNYEEMYNLVFNLGKGAVIMDYTNPYISCIGEKQDIPNSWNKFNISKPYKKNSYNDIVYLYDVNDMPVYMTTLFQPFFKTRKELIWVDNDWFDVNQKILSLDVNNDVIKTYNYKKYIDNLRIMLFKLDNEDRCSNIEIGTNRLLKEQMNYD